MKTVVVKCPHCGGRMIFRNYWRWIWRTQFHWLWWDKETKRIRDYRRIKCHLCDKISWSKREIQVRPPSSGWLFYLLTFIEYWGIIIIENKKRGIDMKVNYKRSYNKQKEAEWEKRQKEREEFLSKMTPEEREIYTLKEKKQAMNALKTMGMAQAMLGDNPYSKI